MDFRLLGPLEVAEDGHPVSLGGSRARALLALLLLHRNAVLTLDQIVDELWPERPPKTAEQVVRVYVSNLRKALEPAGSGRPPQVILTRGNGYLLRAGPDEVDVDRFEALRAEGRRLLAAGEVTQAAAALGDAIALWRGAPLQDFAYERFAQPEIARLEELRLVTLEDRFDAQLALGRDSELVADLDHLVEANPLRERLRAQLMLALYRSGRQADALEIYQRGRRHLVDELGLEPSESLRRLETRILQQDPELDRPSATLPLKEPANGPPPRPRRLALAGVTALVLAAIATAGILIAATTGHSPRRPGASSLRVALVVNQPRNTTPTTVTLDPINGLHNAAEEVGARTKIFYGGCGTCASFFRTVAEAAGRSDLVIVEATPDVEQLSQVTARFPKTRFLIPDSVFDPGASFRGQRNVTGVNFHDRENAELGGYLAGLMTHGHGAVSAVGGIRKVQSVRDLIAGFKAGARLARPDIRVLVTYTGTFYPLARCAKAAIRQIDHGSVVVFDAAGACGTRALMATMTRGVWGIGVDSDLSYLGPTMLASVVKRFDKATQLAVELFASRQLPRGRDIQLDLYSGNVGLTGINSAAVPEAVQRKVTELGARLH